MCYFVNVMKRRAADTNEPTRTIMQHVIANASHAASLQMPKQRSMQRFIQSQRQQETLPDGVIPDDLRLSIRGEPFLRQEGHMFVLATDRNLDLLSNSEV